MRVPEQLITIRGKPQALRTDNGPEFDATPWASAWAWADRHSVELRFIQPGRPMQNGSAERFDRTYREEVLNCCVFEILDEVRWLTAE